MKETVNAIILELGQPNTMFDYIKYTELFPINLVRYYFKSIIHGLLHMLSLGYSHRDMKVENLILTEDFVLKISDFGMATSNRWSSQKLGSEQYFSPQIYLGVEYDCEKADVFSCGVILFIFVFKTYPYKEPSKERDRNFLLF